MINDAGKHEVKNWCGIRSGPRRPARRRRGDRGGAQAGGAVSQGKGSGNQSWTRISTRCAKSLGWRGNRKLTLYRHTARWLGLVRPRGSDRVLFDAGRGFGGARVDEVTRDTHSPEEVSGRGAAAQGRPDRRHDQRV